MRAHCLPLASRLAVAPRLQGANAVRARPFYQRLVLLGPGRRKRNELASALLLPLFDVLKDRIQIVPEQGCVLVAHSPNFIDNGIVHGFVSKSAAWLKRPTFQRARSNAAPVCF